MTTVVLVEGESDRRALEVLAARRGLDLSDAAGVEIVVMSGITNLPKHLRRFPDARVLVLYDAAENRYVGRVMERSEGSAELFACDADLEDELIDALGHERVLAVIAAAGELASYDLLRRQPARRDLSERQNLRRFFTSHSGRKLRYAGLLVEALDLDAVPDPLDDLLAALGHPAQQRSAPGGDLGPGRVPGVDA